MTISNGSPEQEPRPDYRGFDPPHRRSIFFPLLLLAAGVLLLLSNLNILGPDIWNNLIRLWPLLFIVGALDGIYRGEGLAGQIFWLGLGILFLLASLGYLSINIWDVLLRFWPVFLIALGIDILFGNRKEIWARGLAVLISLALLVGVVWFAGINFTGRGVQLQSTTINQPAEGATAASYDISMAAGLFELSGGAPTGQLLSGEVRSANQGGVRESMVTQNGRAIYTLKDDNVTIHVGNNSNRRWTFELNDSIPTDLDFSMGAGEARLDLTGMELERVDATVAVGELNIDLPQTDGYEADLTTVIGQTVIRIPSDAAVEIQVDGIFPVNVSGQGLTLNGRTVTATGSGPVTRIKVTNIIGSTSIERVR
jgi:hypothetical protein